MIQFLSGLLQGSETFSVKGQRVILAFVGHMVFVTTTQLCWCSVKTAIDQMETNEHGCVPIKLY